MSTEPSPTHGGETPSTDGQDVRTGRHRLPVVAVAAAVLVAGGGGAWWASGWGSPGGSADAGSTSEPPRLALDGPAAGGEGGGERPGIAPGEPHPQVYRANGELPDGPGTASVHRGPAHAGRASVAALADALGVEGKPEKKSGRWVVRGSGKSPAGMELTVNDDRMAGNWTYRSDGRKAGTRCGKPLPTVPGGLTGPERGGDVPSSCSPVPDSGKGDPPSERKAEDAVEPLLKTLKLQDARLAADVTTGSLRMVTATPVVDGMPARDWTSTFTVDRDGRLVRGHGHLGGLRKGASYPVMSAEETLKYLNKPGSVASGAVSGSTVREPQPGPPAWEPPRAAEGTTEPGKAAPGRSGSGAAEPARPGGTGPGKVSPRRALKVTGAEFGLETRYSAGRPVLVPSWIYEVRLPGERTVSVAHPAIEPKYLERARPAQPGRGSGSSRAEEPGPAPAQAVTSYTADGRTVKLTFWGGVCHGYSASAEESGSTVKVTVRPENQDPKKVCVKMAKRRTVEVELDEPVGDRKVVDAADGESLPRK